MHINTLKWYGVKLIYCNRIIGDPKPNYVDDNFIENYIAYEESLLLIHAESFQAAFEKAEMYALEEQDDYINIYGQKVQVRFHNSIDCFLISEDGNMILIDGLEVYSNLIEETTNINQNELLKQTFPISKKPNYMLLNIEFNRKS